MNLLADDAGPLKAAFSVAQVCEALQLLIGLLEGATSHGGRRPDQLYPLMFEADAADQLYALLTRPRHAVEVKEKVVRVSSTAWESSPGE